MKKLTRGQWAVLRLADRGLSLYGHRFVANKLEKKGLLSSRSIWSSPTSKGNELLAGKKKVKRIPAQRERAGVVSDSQGCYFEPQGKCAEQCFSASSDKGNLIPTWSLRLKLTWGQIREMIVGYKEWRST